MAALIKHGLSKNNEITINLLFRKSLNALPCRYYANKKYKYKPLKAVVPQCRKLKSTEESIASRGFLRCQRSYVPPANLEERLESLYAEAVGENSKPNEAFAPTIKYTLLSACFNEFKHSVPNSILHKINNYNDVLDFYKTPVDATLPLDKMKTADLPPNLHIQYEALRFLPEEDTMFGGQTAFPESNTLVTGIRPRKKYKGHKTTELWPMSIKNL